MLGPVFFGIYINDLPDTSVCQTLIYADDTKSFTANPSPTNTLHQDDIDAKLKWSLDWQILFNPQKCKILHCGHSNPKTKYQMGTNTIEADQTEKDLGVTIDNKLNFTKHINSASAKANRTLTIIKQNFPYLDPDTFLTLYKSKVRPILEFASPVWNPHLKNHIRNLERVQQRATKLIPALRHLTYPQRLRRLGLPTLEYRRLRQDLLTTFVSLTRSDSLNHNEILPPLQQTHTTRGHRLRLTKERTRTTAYGHGLRHRIVNDWNKLPENVIASTSINMFKSRLNQHHKNHPDKFTPSTYP